MWSIMMEDRKLQQLEIHIIHPLHNILGFLTGLLESC